MLEVFAPSLLCIWNLDFYEALVEKAGWELHEEVACCF